MFFPGKKLINDPNSVVKEFIEGLVQTYPGLQYLEGFPEVKVVLHTDAPGNAHDRVAVISGGGSGHEPAHAGFVGAGMLTAAICGDIFTSPPVHSILSGIRAVTGSKGCLLIVKNYTGDRLNFGLAAEQAKQEGYEVETVVVGDDCALLHSSSITGRRGLAGTLFVQKVAGAAAASGLSLSSVAAEAKRASGLISTMAVALSVCTLPGQLPSQRLGPQKIELGLGIHGEPGATVSDMEPLDDLVSRMLDQILTPKPDYAPVIHGGCRVALMINGLGGTTVTELMIACGRTTSKLQHMEHRFVVDRVYVGSLMTSLDMSGFSISLMRTDGDWILDRLDAPTAAPHWPSGHRPHLNPPFPSPSSPPHRPHLNPPTCRPPQLSKQGLVLESAIEAAANSLICLRDSLNQWDSVAGDGDCGSTMHRGAVAVLHDVRGRYPLDDVAGTLREIGASVGRAMGGTSGVIYEIMSEAAGASLKREVEEGGFVTARQWADAMEEAVAAIGKYGGASVGYRTVLDSLVPALRSLRQRLEAGDDGFAAFLVSSEAAMDGAKSTAGMKARVS